MHHETFEKLNKLLLERIETMFASGSSIEEILRVLSDEDSNDKMYRFYLEAACGTRLDGSIYLAHWNSEDHSTRNEILGYLEGHAAQVRKYKSEGYIAATG